MAATSSIWFQSPIGKTLPESLRRAPHSQYFLYQLTGFLATNRNAARSQSGKLANVLVLNQDQLVNIGQTNSIRYVMKNGELFEGDTLKQVWPKQKAAPAF